MRCLLTHLVKVFFCTRSRSSGRDKPGYLGPGRSPGGPQEVTTMHTQWLALGKGLRITLRPSDPLPSPQTHRDGGAHAPASPVQAGRGPPLGTPMPAAEPPIVSLLRWEGPELAAADTQRPKPQHKSRPAPPPHAASRRPEQSGSKPGPRTGEDSGGSCVLPTGQPAFSRARRTPTPPEPYSQSPEATASLAKWASPAPGGH